MTDANAITIIKDPSFRSQIQVIAFPFAHGRNDFLTGGVNCITSKLHEGAFIANRTIEKDQDSTLQREGWRQHFMKLVNTGSPEPSSDSG